MRARAGQVIQQCGPIRDAALNAQTTSSPRRRGLGPHMAEKQARTRQLAKLIASFDRWSTAFWQWCRTRLRTPTCCPRMAKALNYALQRRLGLSSLTTPRWVSTPIIWNERYAIPMGKRNWLFTSTEVAPACIIQTGPAGCTAWNPTPTWSTYCRISEHPAQSADSARMWMLFAHDPALPSPTTHLH